MVFSAYNSKIYPSIFLVFISIVAIVFLGFWETMPLTAKVLYVIIVVVCFIACFFQLFSSRPVIIADEEGLQCFNLMFRKIKWEDIVSAVRVPRLESFSLGKKSCYSLNMFEKWRPIDLHIRNLQKYLTVIPPQAKELFPKSNYHNCTILRIECAGTTADSEELFSYISSRILGSKI